MNGILIPQPARVLSKNDVSEIHKKEWQAFRESILIPAADTRDMNEASFAKSIAESIRIAQEGERKAWGFADAEIDTELTIGWMSEDDGNDAA